MGNMTEKNAQFDGSIPEMYDLHLGPLLFAPFARDLAARIARIRPRRVLEVAAGTGILTQRIRAVLPPDAELIATDLNEPMLRAGVGNVRGAGRSNDVVLLAGRAEQLPLRDASFDAVSFSYLLRYVDDPQATLAEMARWLRPGGTMAGLEFFVPPAHATCCSGGGEARSALQRCVSTCALREVVSFVPWTCWLDAPKPCETWGRAQRMDWSRSEGRHATASRVRESSPCVGEKTSRAPPGRSC